MKYIVTLNQKKYDCLTSVAFCLEDSIEDGALHIAEDALCDTLSKLEMSNVKLPLLFTGAHPHPSLRREHDRRE